MKINILSFLLGLFMISLMLATVVNSGLVTIKPQTPKLTVSYCGVNPEMFTQTYAKKGFVVVTSASQGYHNSSVKSYQMI